MNLDTLTVGVDDDGLAHLTLDRPRAANTIDLPMAQELLEVANDFHRRGDVRAILLTGRGERFCAGGDLKSFAAAEDALPSHLEELTVVFHAALVRLLDLDAPVIAGVHGSAAGAGFSLVCAADLVVAGAGTRFVMAYAGVGLSPDGSGSWFLPRLVGLRRALDLALTNRVLDADEALDWGIVSRVVPPDRVQAEAEALARSLAAGPTSALGAARRLLRGSWERSLEEQLQAETRALGATARTADGREGVRAFAEGRAPDFGS